MTQRKDVANNPEQTAQDIMVYLLTYQGEAGKKKLQTELDHILQLAKREYSGESMSYFNQYFIYPISRKRHSDLEEAITRLKGCSEEQFGRFVIIVDLLNKGGACKSTSLNTIILDKLIAATGKYNPIDEDSRLDASSSLSSDARPNVREIIKGIFIAKAQECIVKHVEEKQKEEEQKRLAAKAADYVEPKRLALNKSIIDELDRILKGKKKNVPVVSNKLNPRLLAEKHAMLSAIFNKPRSVKVEKGENAPLMHPIANQGGMIVPVVARKNVSAEAAAVQVNLGQPRKLSHNPAFAESLRMVGGFFAEKYKPKKVGTVKEKFAEQFSAIKKHFGSK